MDTPGSVASIKARPIKDYSDSETDLTMEVDNVLEEESQVEWQSRGEVKTSQTELMKRNSPLSLNLSHLDAKPESNQHGCYEEQITDPSLAHLPCWGGPLDIGQMLTYLSRGHPKFLSRPTVNIVDSLCLLLTYVVHNHGYHHATVHLSFCSCVYPIPYVAIRQIQQW